MIGQHADHHSDVLEDVREDQRGKADAQENADVIRGAIGDDEAGDDEKPERADEDDSAKESPLVRDDGEI